MSDSESNSHSFAVRIWLEPGTAQRTWRGYVVHVMTGERRSFQDLADLAAFIRPYIESMFGAAGQPPSGE